MRLSDLTFKQRFALMVGVVVASFIAVVVLNAQTLERVRINGAMYRGVAQDKDLRATIAHPPLFAIQASLLAHRAVLAST